MTIELNRQIIKAQTSKIRQFNDYAKSVGADVIMTLGEPDFRRRKNSRSRDYCPTPKQNQIRPDPRLFGSSGKNLRIRKSIQ